MISLHRSPSFRREVEQWQGEGIISPEQAAILVARYELDREPPWYLRSGFMLSAVAVVLSCMGVLLFISENWEQLGVPLRMATGLVPLMVAYAAAIKYRSMPDRAELAMFAGSILFGVNIFLQAQIFHISAYYPNGFLWWLIGALPVAWYFRSALHTTLSLLLYIVWCSLQSEYNHFSYLSPILFAALLYVHFRRPAGAVMPVMAVAFYVFTINLTEIHEYLRHPNYLTFCIGFFALLLALPTQHIYAEEASARFRRWTFWLLTIAAFVASFSSIQSSLSGTEEHLIGILLAAVALILAIIDRSLERIIAAGIAVGIIILATQSSYATAKEIAGYITFQFLSWAGWTIYNGMKRRDKGQFLWGITMLLGLAIARYIDYFGDYMVMSLLFIAGGIGVAGLNSMWNKRYREQS